MAVHPRRSRHADAVAGKQDGGFKSDAAGGTHYESDLSWRATGLE